VTNFIYVLLLNQRTLFLLNVIKKNCWINELCFVKCD